MGMVHLSSALLISLTSLLPASCHKTSPGPNVPKNPATITTPTNALVAAPTHEPTSHNLGEVTLTNHYETCVQLGDGKNCTLTPRMLDRHNVQITVAFESKNAAGKTRDLSVTQVVAREGKRLEVVVGNFSFSFTPRLNEK